VSVGSKETAMTPETEQTSLEEIAARAEIGSVREPEFRLVADLIRMTILGHEARAEAA
jgi:hypothetical protein